MNSLMDVHPEDWTCPVCRAVHGAPALSCRRCGASLLPFARLAVIARRLREEGRDDTLAQSPGTVPQT